LAVSLSDNCLKVGWPRSILGKIQAKIEFFLVTHIPMKFPAIFATLAVSSIIFGQITPVFAQIGTNEPPVYKTRKGQVVVTKLKPKQSFEVKYKNQKGRLGSRKVNTNGCGEALISGAGKYQSLSIDSQEIQLSNLPTKEHPRCKPAKKAQPQFGK
jgi:hypothetical protein